VSELSGSRTTKAAAGAAAGFVIYIAGKAGTHVISSLAILVSTILLRLKYTPLLSVVY
jgi:hypothetical protein